MDAHELLSLKNRYGIVGNAPGLNYALEVAVQVAPTNLTVLITGESGVGKEVFSQIIHKLSPRKHNQFIAVNCGAIPEGTIDSELFGHEKGAFTGAIDSRKGYFEFVSGGTIFLDEIAELPLGTQARLLRVLESGEFIRVGTSTVQKTDVRVVAATNVDLFDRVKQHRFREDLYYRLNTVPIKVPPLRERGNDMAMLFKKFANDFAERQRIQPIQMNESANRLLISYTWPGNIRQLKNVAEQISILSKERLVTADNLLHFIPEATISKLPVLVSSSDDHSGSMNEREILYKVLFEMKKDMNDLKSFVVEMAKINNLQTGAINVSHEHNNHAFESVRATNESSQPVIMTKLDDSNLVEVTEESLNVVEKEKELITKALKKHKGRRNRAAKELGLSERTLYRKIKEYELEK